VSADSDVEEEIDPPLAFMIVGRCCGGPPANNPFHRLRNLTKSEEVDFIGRLNLLSVTSPLIFLLAIPLRFGRIESELIGGHRLRALADTSLLRHSFPPLSSLARPVKRYTVLLSDLSILCFDSAHLRCSLPPTRP
jgi:hypothetical protein